MFLQETKILINSLFFQKSRLRLSALANSTYYFSFNMIPNEFGEHTFEEKLGPS